MSHVPSFGGFTAACLERIVDEYPKLGLLTFSLMGDYTSIWDKRRASVGLDSHNTYYRINGNQWI
jgi:hypothetical protein